MGIAQRGLLREDRADRGRHIRVTHIALVLLPLHYCFSGSWNHCENEALSVKEYGSSP